MHVGLWVPKLYKLSCTLIPHVKILSSFQHFFPERGQIQPHHLSREPVGRAVELVGPIVWRHDSALLHQLLARVHGQVSAACARTRNLVPILTPDTRVLLCAATLRRVERCSRPIVDFVICVSLQKYTGHKFVLCFSSVEMIVGLKIQTEKIRFCFHES